MEERAMKVRKLAHALGAEITGVDLKEDLDAGTILSVMQQHIISTVCLHQQQLQQAWRLINEEDKALQTAKSKAGTTPS
jgi:hypothetical protein